MKADKELKDAEDNLQKAKDKLAETLRLSKDKVSLESKLKVKSNEFDEFCKHVDDLKRDVRQKEDEAEKARKAKDESEREYQKLLLRKTIDDALIPEQPEFKGGVNGEGLIQPELPEFPLDKLPKVEELGKEPGQAGAQNVKPVGPAPRYKAPAVLSPVQEEAGQKALPNTGSQVSLLALLGYAFLAGLGIALKKKEG